MQIDIDRLNENSRAFFSQTYPECQFTGWKFALGHNYLAAQLYFEPESQTLQRHKLERLERLLQLVSCLIDQCEDEGLIISHHTDEVRRLLLKFKQQP